MSDAYLEYIEEFSIEIANFNPIGPTAYIPLPETLLKRNNGIINIQNDDDWCFGWSVLGALHPVKVHPERNLHHLYGAFMEELNMDDILISVPVLTPVYKKFEENNPEISLYVYEWHNHNECFEFRYVSERRGDEYKQVNLLVITEEERSHYCIIKDLHKLIRYNEHLPKCKGLNNASQQPQMPVKNRNLEMLTEKLTPEKKTKLTHTKRLHMHKPCGYCYVVVRMNSSLNYEIISYDLYRGPDALERFVTKIEKKLANIQEDLSVPAEMIMAPGDLKAYNEESCIEKEHPKKKEAQKRYREALSALNRKVKDHNHINRKYRGPAHDSCNKKLQNIGKYKAIDVEQLQFLDSFQHIGMGLDKLVECLGGKIKKFILSINKEDYEHAQKVWQIFEIKNFEEYYDLYLETDVLLLADVFMNYTIMCLKDDGLDPSHYVSAPGMFNNSLYKSSRVELKLMTDMDEYLIVENGIREGMTMASHRYAKANNPQCPDYEPSKPKSWALYEDMNALYSGAMTQYMSTEILGKVSPEEVPNIQSIAPDTEIGYILEVDLEAPVHLHDYFADYPFASEKQIISENWLSLYNEILVHDKNVKEEKYVSEEKLVQTLFTKKNYIVHYQALQTYMKFRIKVTKIHSTLKFRQSPWMKEYIEENIRKRKIAKANGNEFGVVYYKLKNNAVFSKQMENVRKHMRVELL
ncbi:17406_t:CDS:2 [Cetraspora pellucida]|uniref:17403_t:CDS:1 n=2 Tax=Cetraspora pellucida TaxID=1433469 RepID=A0ACA9L1I5_9GLOM|nr:17403_t:CDS:2 [Cetraspora pellucida]CAG8505808.1 17406_t:CDS:2 [Cetraspora pellucida]